MGRSFAADDTSHYSLVQPNDIVYTRSPLAIYKLGIVKQNHNQHNAIVSPLYGVFEPTNKHIGRIIEAYFESPERSLNYLDPLCQKGAKNTINVTNDTFLSGLLYLPDDEAEQQKIADCLGSLDDWIAAADRKLAALRNHKRGLLQQLFPKPNQSQPQQRFPEFQEAPVWRNASIGSLANVKAAGDLDKSLSSDAETSEHPFPVYSNSIDQQGLYGFYSNSKYRGGSVTITARGTLGKAFFRPNDFMAIGRLVVVSELVDLNPVFFTECWNHTVVIPDEVTSIPQLTAVTVRSTKIPLPELEEQQKIAACLTALDTQITAQATQLNTLHQHKRGLMQQLFPSLEDC